jgi:hypothetical protein
MKKQLTFMAVMMFLGVLAAGYITVVLGAIAVPAYDSYLLTLAEHHDYQRMHEIFGPLGANADPLIVVALVLLAATLTLFLNTLNPNLRLKRLKTGRAIGKLSVIILVVVSVAVLYSFLSDGVEGTLWLLLVTPVAFSLVWSVAGETGWAGDLTTWKYERSSGQQNLTGTLTMGAMWGVTAALIGIFSSQAFNKYFILVSEVLDGSGETSYAGFIQIFEGLAFLLSLGGGILIGLAFSLAPTTTPPESRKRLLFPPAILLLIFLLVIGGGYLYSVARHDLGTKTLVEAARLPDEAPRIMTIANLSAVTTSEAAAWAWPLEVETWGFAYSDTVTVSESVLMKLDDFLEEKRGVSTYQYNAMDVRLKGAFAIFDLPGAEKLQFAYSRDLLLPRMILLHRLKYLPVTDENRKFLQGYADEDVWHIPGRAALALAKGFDHFGMTAETRKWFERARNSGTDLEGFEPSQEPALMNGSVSGTVLVDGAKPRDVILGLMLYKELGDEITISNLQMDLLATVHPEDNGSFTFRDLGSGEYRLVALLTGVLDPASIHLTGSAGIIKLTKGTPEIDLGTILVSRQ